MTGYKGGNIHKTEEENKINVTRTNATVVKT